MSFIPWKTGKRTGCVVYQGHVVVAIFENQSQAVDAVRAMNAHADLVASLDEMHNLVSRIYRKESVAGEVLDALDSARAALKKAGIEILGGVIT